MFFKEMIQKIQMMKMMNINLSKNQDYIFNMKIKFLKNSLNKLVNNTEKLLIFILEIRLLLLNTFNKEMRKML